MILLHVEVSLLVFLQNSIGHVIRMQGKLFLQGLRYVF